MATSGCAYSFARLLDKPPARRSRDSWQRNGRIDLR
jgi:hypothetical protein